MPLKMTRSPQYLQIISTTVLQPGHPLKVLVKQNHYFWYPGIHLFVPPGESFNVGRAYWRMNSKYLSISTTYKNSVHITVSDTWKDPSEQCMYDTTNPNHSPFIHKSLRKERNRIGLTALGREHVRSKETCAGVCKNWCSWMHHNGCSSNVPRTQIGNQVLVIRTSHSSKLMCSMPIDKVSAEDFASIYFKLYAAP